MNDVIVISKAELKEKISKVCEESGYSINEESLAKVIDRILPFSDLILDKRPVPNSGYTTYQRFNVNERLKFKLTPFGRKAYKHRYDSMNTYLTASGAPPLKCDDLRADDEGYSYLQLWEFMQVFGDYFFMGMTKTVIQNNNIFFKIYDPDDLEDDD